MNLSQSSERETVKLSANSNSYQASANSSANSFIAQPVICGPVLSSFYLISGCTSISAVLCFIAQLLAIYFLDFEVREALIRIYCILFLFSVFFIETEVTIADPLRSFFIVQSWTLRGLSYIFIALLVFADDEDRKLQNSNVLLYINASASAMFTFGIIYFIMGCVCLKPIRDRKMARYIQLLSQAEIHSTLRERSQPQAADGADI